MKVWAAWSGGAAGILQTPRDLVDLVDLVDSVHMALEANATRERGAAPCWPGTRRRCCQWARANPAAHAKGVGPGRPYPAMGLQPTHQGYGRGLPWAQAGLPWAQAGLPWVDPGVTLTGLP